jgi:hypothetical protein
VHRGRLSAADEFVMRTEAVSPMAHLADLRSSQVPSRKRKEISMRVRYLSYLCLGVAAAFLVVATVAFPLSTVVWLSLGLGIGMLAVSLGVAARSREDVPSLVISSCIAAVSA